MSDTASRAADCFPGFFGVKRNVGAAIRLPDEGGGFIRAPLHNASEEERPMSWNDERVELLKKLWNDGLSASQIAAELGGITRNAVIGKVHRLGLSGRAKSPSSTVPRPRKPRAPSHILRIGRSTRGNTALAPIYELDIEPEPELIENIIPIGQRCNLLELNEEKCRWPIGDPGTPEFFFCGGRSIEGLPYCGYHSRVAYQPVAARRDKRAVRG
jgi:GcrA cell cycle regulator